MKKEEFVKRTQSKSKEILDPIALEALAKMVNDGILVYDTPYIEARTREIVEKKIKNTQKVVKKLIDDRKDALKKAISRAAQEEILLEKQPDDATGERRKRCEDLAQYLAHKLLDNELVNKDSEYLDDAIKDDEFLLAFNRMRSFMDVLFDTLFFSIDQSYLRANKKLWGKHKDDISIVELDKILKST